MARCDFCKAAEIVAGTCPNCGRILCNFQECHIISGTKPSTELARISITDKYMMLYIRGAGKTVASASFGLLGALAAEALSSGNRYGFYDLKEIEKVIYPYRNSKFKKDNALKIVNKEGNEKYFYCYKDNEKELSYEDAKQLIEDNYEYKPCKIRK